MSRYITRDIDYSLVSNEDKLDYASGNYVYSAFEAKCHLEDYLRFFSKKDLDIIFLSFLSGKKQNDVSAIMDKTQPAISYDINRIQRQMEFVIFLMTQIDDFLHFTKTTTVLEIDEIDLLVALFFSTSMSRASKILRQHQMTCRAKFIHIMQKLKEYPEHTNIYALFVQVENNFNRIKKNVYDKNSVK